METNTSGALRPSLVDWTLELFKYWQQERSEVEGTWRLAYDAYRAKYSSENLARWRALEGSKWRSTVFVRLTKLKVIAAVSQVDDLLSSGDPWSLSPTPVPTDRGGLRLSDDEARVRSELMAKQVSDRLTEAKFLRKLRNSVMEGAIYGSCALKAPVVRHVSRTGYQMQIPRMAGLAGMVFGPGMAQRFGRHVPVQQTSVVPSVEHPSIWDVYWDPETDDTQTGQGVIHRVMMSPAMLRQLEDEPGYDRQAINRVIDAHGIDTRTGGTGEDGERPGHAKLGTRKRSIRVVEFWGRVPKEHLAAINPKTNEPTFRTLSETDGREVEVFFVLAGDEVIRPPVRNPNTGNLRPIHVAQWERVPHELAGVGIPENIQDSQTMVNGLTRCLLDNKALSANVLIGLVEGALAPGETANLYPGKTFRFSQGVPNGDVRNALQFFSPEDATGGIIEAINMFERFADAESGLPNITHGETSRHDPKTAFAFAKLLEGATRQLGETIRNFDEGQIEPIVEAFYHWEMAHNPEEAIKGDMAVEAKGFATFRDRVAQGQTIQNAITVALSSELLAGVTNLPELWREQLKTWGLDEQRFALSDEQLAQRAAAIATQAQLAEPPPEGGDAALAA